MSVVNVALQFSIEGRCRLPDVAPDWGTLTAACSPARPLHGLRAARSAPGVNHPSGPAAVPLWCAASSNPNDPLALCHQVWRFRPHLPRPGV